jgi:hypothetical protein
LNANSANSHIFHRFFVILREQTTLIPSEINFKLSNRL